MPGITPSNDFFTVGTTAKYVGADSANVKKIHKLTGSNLHYKVSDDVSTSDSQISVGTPLTASAGYWLISAGTTHVMVEEMGQSVKASDLTAADDLTVTDDATISDTLTVAGVTTLTGGVGATSTLARAISSTARTTDLDTSATLASLGTDAAAADNKTVYLASLFVPINCTVTGIATLNGTNVTTDKFVNYLFNAAGTKVGQTAAAGTAPTPADTFQEVDLTAPVTVTGPAVYFIGRQHNGTTIGFQSIPAAKGLAPLAGSVAGSSFGAETSVTPPTTFTADKGPIGYLY